MTVNVAPMSLSDLQQRVPTTNRWENLEQMYSECTNMFGELMIYPQTFRQFKGQVTPEEEKHLTRILKNIEVDAKRLKNELDQIRTQHLDPVTKAPIKGIVYDEICGGDLFTFVGIASSYRNWMDGFQAITAQPALDFEQITIAVKQRQAPTNPQPA